MIATITRLYGNTTKPQSHLARELQYLKAREARHAPAPRILTDPTYWRDRGDANRRGICYRCGGTGEVPEMGLTGEYEGFIPCWVCQPALPNLPIDEEPF